MRYAAPFIALGLFANTANAEDPDTEIAVSHDSRWERELTIAAGISSMSFTMPGMQLMGSDSTARAVMPGAVSESQIEPSALFALRYRIRDRVLWSIPTLSFAYLGGTAGQREWIPWAGVTSWGAGYSSIEHFIAQGGLGAGIGIREWLGPSTAINFTAGATSAFRYTSNPTCPPGTMCDASWVPPETWTAAVTAGGSHRIGNAVTLNIGVGGSQRLLVEGRPADGSEQRGVSVSIGSVQAIGLRQLPLIQAQVSQRWSLDGYAAASFDVSREHLEHRYLVGFTRVWWTPATR